MGKLRNKDSRVRTLNAEHYKNMLINKEYMINLKNVRLPKVLKTLKEDAWGKNAKIIVLTASADLDTLSQTLEMGGMDYMVKTDWKLDEIVRKINEKLLK